MSDSQRLEARDPEVPFAPIEALVAAIRAGKLVVLADDADRENEGDLVVAAEQVTPEIMSFIVRHTGGWVCLVLDDASADRLELAPLADARRPQCKYGTAFLTPIDAREGIGTGISARDRATTVAVAIDPDSTPDHIVRGGHISPLLARPGGVLVRTGHTEASVDLCRLAGLRPLAVLSEIVSDTDGEPLRLCALVEFCRRHDLLLGNIADLVAYRHRTEKLVERRAVVRLPTEYGPFELYHYRSRVDGAEHLALVHGFTPLGATDDPARYADTPMLVRVHSECLTGEVFHSRRCDCGPQLDAALSAIACSDAGVLLYLRQEGRGIGLEHKMKAYELQEQGLDTVEANEQLGFAADQRDFGIGAQILADLGVRQMRLMTNNPRKFTALEGYGLEITAVISLEMPAGPDNAQYLRTKKEKLGHRLTLNTERPPENVLD